MPNGIFLIQWDEVEGGIIYLKYPESLEIPNPVVQQITISHNFTESYIITEEKNWNSVSYYNENKEMIIVLVLSKFDDGNDYLEILEKFNREIDECLFGEKLVDTLGGETLCRLAEQDKLIPFLEEQKFKGKPLIQYLSGWMGKMLPL